MINLPCFHDFCLASILNLSFLNLQKTLINVKKNLSVERCSRVVREIRKKVKAKVKMEKNQVLKLKLPLWQSRKKEVVCSSLIRKISTFFLRDFSPFSFFFSHYPSHPDWLNRILGLGPCEGDEVDDDDDDDDEAIRVENFNERLENGVIVCRLAKLIERECRLVPPTPDKSLQVSFFPLSTTKNLSTSI